MKKILLVVILLLSTISTNAQISITAAYKPSIFKSEGEIIIQNGVSLNVLYKAAISDHIPLSIQSGLGFHYMFNKIMRNDLHFSNIYIPVNIAYKFDVKPSFSIYPYAGIYGRYVIQYEKTKRKVQQPPVTTDLLKQYPDKFNRTLIGSQLGLMLDIHKHFRIDISYGFDFYKFNKGTYSSALQSLSIGLGYTF